MNCPPAFASVPGDRPLPPTSPAKFPPHPPNPPARPDRARVSGRKWLKKFQPLPEGLLELRFRKLKRLEMSFRLHELPEPETRVTDVSRTLVLMVRQRLQRRARVGLRVFSQLEI